MSYQEFHDNMKTLMQLIDQFRTVSDEKMSRLLNFYIEQNITLVNDVVCTSIHHLKRLEKANSANDIICTQARLTNEISQKVSLSTQRFLNVSLGQIADYNEWLKAHCDLATD